MPIATLVDCPFGRFTATVRYAAMIVSRRILSLLGLFVLLLPLGLVVFSPVPASNAREAQKKAAIPFTLPPGFVAELVAAPPQVEHPIMANFDERGRLFLADNAGMNLRAPDLLTQLPNCFRVLEDRDGDGTFEHSHIFADKMAFPMGVLPHRGFVYSLAAPSFWKLSETPDGKAGQRTELVTRFGFTGNAADVHGPFLGPDGRLYWTDGRHGHEIKQPDGTVLKGKAARIFRCKPDGTEVEGICGGGMDDPVEMAFTDEGEPFATVDILVGTPSRIDAIIYCIDGGAFPYYEPVMGEFKRTGDLLPPVTELGWVAPSGLMRYRSEAFGKDYKGNLFSTQFNTHKVVRHILERDGAHFKSKNEDFLVSTNPDFHPTDVLEDADGSLLVVDTGGWFRIGCPTSQIAKPEIKGAIYRIRKQSAPRIDDPRGLKLAWKDAKPVELTERLGDPRWAVRDRAVEERAERGGDALTDLRDVILCGKSVEARRNAIWALTRIESPASKRIDGPASQRYVRLGLTDSNDSVRLAAVRSVGLRRDALALAELVLMARGDKESQPAIRREAATALGRIRDPKAVPDLLAGLAKPADRFLEHALIHAIIEINNREATLPGLRDASVAVRRAALIALDQMDAGGLTRADVLPLIGGDDAALQQTVLGVISRRPEWAGDLLSWLRASLGKTDLPESRRELLKVALGQFSKNVAVQNLVAEGSSSANFPQVNRLLLIEVMALAPVDKLPPAWIDALKTCLAGDNDLARQALATIKARNVAGCEEALRQLAGDAAKPADIRVAAMAALGNKQPGLEAAWYGFLRGRLNPDLSPLERLAAAQALARLPLADEQLLDLATLLPAAGTLELPSLVAAFERSKNPEVGKALLGKLAFNPSLVGLGADRLKAALEHQSDAVKQSATPLFQKLTVDGEKQKARLTDLEPLMDKGQAAMGKGVFFGKKAICSACHAVQGIGGQIGPDLSKIGGIRTGRDLLEAIVFPSASIVRGYEPFSVTTKDGRLHAGLIRRETADAIFLVNADRAEVRISRKAIETVEPGRVSLMPQGIDAQLTPQELADLIAYMRSLK